MAGLGGGGRHRNLIWEMILTEPDVPHEVVYIYLQS